MLSPFPLGGASFFSPNVTGILAHGRGFKITVTLLKAGNTVFSSVVIFERLV